MTGRFDHVGGIGLSRRDLAHALAGAPRASVPRASGPRLLGDPGTSVPAGASTL
jgi:hypothetical protein